MARRRKSLHNSAMGLALPSHGPLYRAMTNLTKDIPGLLALMARLRDPDTGCPWDREQTFATIAPYTIEEAYEVAAAIEDGDAQHIKEELGDLLFQVVFHARMAEERGQFDFSDVVATLVAKMVARHPHVFGDVDKPDSAAAQTDAWETLKARERASKEMSILDDVPRALPALMRAEKLQKRASKVGFDWESAPKVVEKLTEEATEICEAQAAGAGPEKLEEEVGDLLFVVANLARHLDVDPEKALRTANTKFVKRFGYIERKLKAKNRSCAEASLDEMEALWVEAKGIERGK
jgi:MazG family protein